MCGARKEIQGKGNSQWKGSKGGAAWHGQEKAGRSKWLEWNE